MKKIIALILALCIIATGVVLCFVFDVFSFFGNNGDEEVDGIEIFQKLYSVSEPTKVVETRTATVGSVVIKGSSTLATGALNDGKTATVLIETQEKFQSVQSGAGETIVPIVGEKPETTTREYVEGMGVRYDGGSWDEAGTNFAPKAGSIANFMLDASKLKNCTYTKDGELQTLSFTVEAKNAVAVFGSSASEIVSDVNVVITANVAVVTGITISYTEALEAEDEDIAYPEASITISTVYTYGIEEITLVK